ncbi:autotransporter assembly complex protein TamA [Falsiroseomonas sp. E2-1-a20]|uniref:autotransporter assembly complex protein TamA n=1 Tax=Falsiroseomonas sp. E2-1-a20 TaxID=3239300 RepID=UPI003F36926D
MTELTPTGDASLDAALAAVSRLAGLEEEAPTTAFGLASRAADDRERLGRALHSEGYWGGTIRILIGGLPLDTPDLADRLEVRTGAPVVVRIQAEPGPLYTISEVSVRATTEQGIAAVAEVTEEPLSLAPGDPATAVAVLAAEARLLARLREGGYPLSSVVRRQTVVNYDQRGMAVTWTLAPGPRAAFAVPRVAGTERIDPTFLARFAANQISGETYSPARLEEARRRILDLRAFSSVRVETAEELNAEGRLPVTFTVAERPRRAIGVTASYETNYGPSFLVYWEHRNLFGQAERLRLEAEVARLGSDGGGVEDSTYRAFATLTRPGLFGRNLSAVGTIGVLRERLTAYDRDAAVASVVLERRFSERLTLGAGPTIDIGDAGPSEGLLSPYQVAGFILNGRWDETDSLLNPTRGWRLTGSVTPSFSLDESALFAPLRVTASTYRRVFGSERSIIALRGTIGSLLAQDRLDAPIHQRFFAGGGGSVRGYDYQSIGPRGANGRLVGGASLLEASVEWRQRFGENWGGVAFIDAGTVGSDSIPSVSDWRIGAGIGVRYHTAIGPIRADIALPLVRQEGSSGYRLYVGIGQAF